MAEASTADLTTLAAGGHIVVVTDDEEPLPKRLPVSDVADGVALAASAIQPADVGTAAYADVADFAPASVLADIEAALAAILGGGD